MKEDKITIVINKPVEEVFEFTTNPKNTHLWISSIEEEMAEEYPPKINTQYKNRRKDTGWNFYKVVEFEKNKVFAMTALDGNLSVRYTYKKFDENKTELEYYVWVKEGELKNPVTKEILAKLKSIMEK